MYLLAGGGGSLCSLSPLALTRLQLELRTEVTRSAIKRLFAAAHLIAIVASADPYSVSNDYIASLAQHSLHKTELIDTLRSVCDHATADLSSPSPKELAP